jgi:FkbM family methyltransferase
MRTLDTGLSFYRKTVKRFRPAHVAVHRLMTTIAIPMLERRHGFRTMVDDPLWFRLELLTGRHEAETVQQLARLVKPGMTVLDIGAHVGYYTRFFARQIGTSGRVYAFEPHPHTFGILHSNTARLSNVTLVQAALAETAGTAELYDYLMMSASGSLHYDESLRSLQKSQIDKADFAPRIAEDFPVEKYSVQTLPVDDYLAGQGVARVDVVKMDIEGAEIGALRGMRQTIANSPELALVVEYNPQALRAFGYQPEEALNEIFEMGFHKVAIIEPAGHLTDITHNREAHSRLTARLESNMGVVNLLFTRQP